MVALLKTTQIQEPSSASVNLTLDTSGNGTFAGTSVMSSPYTMRNKIINGAMQIWQRGTSFSGVSSGSYTADRMYIGYTGSAPTVTQVAGSTGFTYAARVTGAVGNTLTTFGQKIESVNCADLVSKTVTISAVLLASSSQTFTWSIFYANSTDNFSASTQIATGSWSVTTSATTYTATVTLPSQAANGLQFQIYPASAGAFTSGTFDVTGLQLERGTVATPFEYRNYQQELAMCQRYYVLTNPSNTSRGGGLTGSMYSTTAANVFGTFPVPMRTAPTVTAGGTSNTFYISTVSSTASATFSGFGSTINNTFSELSAVTTATVGLPLQYNGQLSATAEL